VSVHPVEQYQVQAVRGASTAQLVGMLYEGLEVFTAEAGLALQGEDPELAAERLRRAQDIVFYLTRTLNPKAGPLAAQLADVYTRLGAELEAARAAADRPHLDAILVLVAELRRLWSVTTGPAPAE
jgi:flagellar biosynthetic protein FliS